MKKNDLINREDAINSVRWGDTYTQVIDRIKALPSADTDMSEYSDRLWKTAYERGKAEAEPRTGNCTEKPTGWIPCSERLPKELEAVNVTWVNHNPPVYYQHIKDVPKADTAAYYRGAWYWWDSTAIDVLAEYGEESGVAQIHKDIEVVAWMPLPKPYREDGEA